MESNQEPRFAFGKNWAKFLELLDERRMEMARDSLNEMLGIDTLAGKTFLDAGSGSGLFSLAAAQLGAETIRSFDYDPDSVACTEELKRRFFPHHGSWVITRGDLLDEEFMQSLPSCDVVYCWGVAHHTGDMWQALDNLNGPLRNGGLLYVALYNDQQWLSKFWRSVKRTYCSGPFRRVLVIATFVPILFAMGVVSDLLHRSNPVKRYLAPRARGMSVVRDWLDWLGGYPFEVARVENVFEFFLERGFELEALKTVGGGSGCNELVFRRSTHEAAT